MRALAGLLLSLVFITPAFPGDAPVDRGDLHPTGTARQLEPTYKIQAGIDGEIYPVFANYASLQRQSDRNFGVVSVTISNPESITIHRRVSVIVPGWSDLLRIGIAASRSAAKAELEWPQDRIVFFCLRRFAHNREGTLVH